MHPMLLRDCKQKIKKNPLWAENMKIFSKSAIKKISGKAAIILKIWGDENVRQETI